MTSSLSDFSRVILPALAMEMRDVLRAGGPPPDQLHAMMQYHMGWLDESFQPVEVHGGKHIRPLLCALSCAAAGGQWEDALPSGAAIELLHNFSLIHDDIEDDSPTRRGRPTLWKLCGIPLAINAGDAMFAASHLALGRLSLRDVPAERIVQAFRRFDETCIELTQGQHADMSFETREQVGVEEYVAMIRGKTAVLLALCAELGALVAGQSEDIVGHYRLFGLNMGLAFQVIDDILGIWGDEIKTGKSAATDIITKKKTLPVLYGLKNSAELRRLYAVAEPDQDFVLEVVSLLEESGAGEEAQARAKSYSSAALEHLHEAQPSGEAAGALQALSDVILHRDF